LSSTPITFVRGDHPPSVPRPGSYPLVVDPIIGNKRLIKVLMDRGSSLNILSVETLDGIGISRSKLCASVFPFLGIVPSMRAYLLGNIDLPVMFGDCSNFRTKTLIFKVVDFEGLYHTILGHSCYSKFMAVPNYSYLKLKMSRLNGVITASGSFEQAYVCGREHFELAIAIANSAELKRLHETVVEGVPDHNEPTLSSAFRPTEDTKAVEVDPTIRPKPCGSGPSS
jgi:hypothetical protein